MKLECKRIHNQPLYAREYSIELIAKSPVTLHPTGQRPRPLELYSHLWNGVLS